jgi:hypothetical protein
MSNQQTYYAMQFNPTKMDTFFKFYLASNDIDLFALPNRHLRGRL